MIATPEQIRKALEKAKRMTKAVISGVMDAPIPREVFSLRVLSCHGSETQEPCRYRKWTDKHGGHHWCDQCGCGEKELAAISRPGTSKPDAPDCSYEGVTFKLHFPYLDCPMMRPGFSNQKSHV